jgi:phage shock protein E
MKRIFIDVRETGEFNSDHVEGAINIPLSKITEDTLREIPKDEEIVLYCRSGGRANIAKGIMSKMGYKNVVNGINSANIASLYAE